MKAPDKVYLRCGRHDSERMDMFWYDEACYPNKPEVEQEYIRKDALIERLEKVAASYKKRSDEGELVWQNMCGIKEAINIINEM